jgi:hypothetical protein
LLALDTATSSLLIASSWRLACRSRPAPATCWRFVSSPLSQSRANKNDALAFRLLNRFLDISDSMGDPDASLQLDNADFEGVAACVPWVG